MKVSLFAVFLLPLAVSACVAPVPPPGGGGSGSADSCGASALQGLVGQPQAVLQTMRFSQPVRVIGYGMAVTMDFSPDRLNIEMGPDGRIARVYCG